MYVVAPTFALALAAGGGMTALDLAGDDRPAETTSAGGTLNRTGAFAEATGSITTGPAPSSESASPSKVGASAPARSGDPTPERRARPSEANRTQSNTTPGSDLPSPSTDAPSTDTSSSSASSPTPPWSSEGPTPTSPSGAPSGGSSPTHSPGSPTPTSDTTPPETSIVSGPTDDLPGVFEFAANETATFQCSLDGAGWVSCGSGLNLSGLDAGWHTLAVRATDQAGNVDRSPAEWTWHTNGK